MHHPSHGKYRVSTLDDDDHFIGRVDLLYL